MVKRLAQPDDIVVCLGAGNITQWAYACLLYTSPSPRDS